MKCKAIAYLILIVTGVMLLSGCSGAVAATVSASNGLSPAAWLALGTLKLEGSSQAITAAQAGQLLTLWQAYSSVSNSDTSSQVELEALVKLIQGVMTTDQLSAIEAMNLSDQTLSEVLQSLEPGVGASAQASTQSATNLVLERPGGAPGGMPPDGGGMSMGDISGEFMAQSTPEASQPAASTQPTQVDVVLLNALLQLLEERSQSSG